ncbi:GH17210 [Drosophila grimshawi]|uniref:GH17210 n=1 Tax=Drosophila grimshawi TaxID=7222 RepID=B4K1T2_DROGR|nr:GH17210 [Drosophila grimshawi]
MLIAPIYCPPQYDWRTHHFTLLFNHIDSLCKGGSFILCGDWNARHSWWGNVRACKRGLALMKCVHSIKRLNILDSGLSVFAQAGLRRRILSSNANISKFQAYLNQRVLLNTEINSGEDIEDAIDILNSNIYEAAKFASSPHLWQKQHSNASVKKTSLDDQTRKLLQLKRQLKREFLVLRTSSARQRYRQVQNRLRKALRLLKVNYLNNLFKQIDAHDRYRMQKLWRMTQTLKRQVEPNWPLKMHSVDGKQTWTRTNSEKAEEFVHHLEARFMPNYLNTEEDRRNVAGELQLLQQQQRIAGDGGAFGTSLPFRPVTLSEVTLEIKALVLKKSPGLDNIDNRVIKNIIVRRIVNASYYTRNQVIRDAYNIKTAEEVFQVTSCRYASSLGSHLNVEARRLLFQPFVPGRLLRPRYTQQLDTHILPLQRQFKVRPSLEEVLPTLIQIEQRELDAAREARELDRLHQLSRQYAGRFSEMTINTLRRKFRDGLISRERLEVVIASQPAQIQDIILPQMRQSSEHLGALHGTQQLRKVRPPAPFDGSKINSLRRDFRLGNITRGNLELEIRGQPAHIQELVLSPVRIDANGTDRQRPHQDELVIDPLMRSFLRFFRMGKVTREQLDEVVLLQPIRIQQLVATQINSEPLLLKRKSDSPLMEDKSLPVRSRVHIEEVLILPPLQLPLFPGSTAMQRQQENPPIDDGLELEMRLETLQQELEKSMDDELLLDQRKFEQVIEPTEQSQCGSLKSLDNHRQHHLQMQQAQVTSEKHSSHDEQPALLRFSANSPHDERAALVQSSLRAFFNSQSEVRFAANTATTVVPAGSDIDVERLAAYTATTVVPASSDTDVDIMFSTTTINASTYESTQLNFSEMLTDFCGKTDSTLEPITTAQMLQQTAEKSLTVCPTPRTVSEQPKATYAQQLLSTTSGLFLLNLLNLNPQ